MVLIPLPVQYILVAIQYLGLIKSYTSGYTFLVILGWLILQIQLGSFMKNLITSWPFLVSILMRYLHYTSLRLTVYHCCYMVVKCGTWTTLNLHKISVAWNNCFRNVCSCCWRDSIKPLQYFCCTLPISYTNVICCFGKNYCSDNVVLSHCLVLCIMSLSHWVAGMICRCQNCPTTWLQDWSGIYLPHLLNCSSCANFYVLPFSSF